jgi:hypothetical protein
MMADKDKVMRGIMFATIKLRKEEIARLLYEQSQGQVMIGAFAGMALLEKLSWDAGDMAAKLP